MQIKIKKSERGGIELFLLGVIVIGAFFLVGGAGFFKKSPVTDSISRTQVVCCDSGNGEACVPSATDTIPFNGKTYGRLRSETRFVEGNVHLKDSDVKATIGGKTYPIILNSSQEDQNFPSVGNCTSNNNDKYLTDFPPGITIFDQGIINYCRETPDDQIIYVCKSGNCSSVPDADCAPGIPYDRETTHCYGDDTSVYDAYFDISGNPAPEVPGFIKNCSQQTAPRALGSPAPQTIEVTPNLEERDNLQLNTFGVSEPGTQSIPWFSPFCKPAVYLYPETKTTVSVKVSPVGPFTYTTPLYTPDGWNVTAYPDGKIISNNTEFPYLYYEADIPSLLIAQPETGFSVKGQDIHQFLLTLLPKMGLNTKETTEMAAYWQKALPTSPYYFVGIIPESTLDSIAPLTVSPKPTTTIRVALYFKATDTIETVIKPVVTSKARTGFSVVEWGGILKTSKPFTCLQ